MTKPTKKQLLVPLLKAGWVSPKDSWQRIGLYALSQRVGELIRDGAPIEKQERVVDGSRFTAYRWAK